MRTHQRRLNVLAVGVIAAFSLPLLAGDEDRPRHAVRAMPTTPATLEHPHGLSTGRLRGAEPLFVEAGLALVRPLDLHGLAAVEGHGPATWDPSSRAWYATAQGTLVRVEPDGRLPVIATHVQGRDIDVRAAAGRAVSREPDDAIVLWDWSHGATARHVVLAGPQFFNPRLSPDGSRILVAESRATGGHAWLVGSDLVPVDIGRADHATWHPDGTRVVFVRLEHDGHRLLASSLYEFDVLTRTQRLLGHTTGPVVTRPAISPDGSWLAFVDGAGGDVMLARLPKGGER